MARHESPRPQAQANSDAAPVAAFVTGLLAIIFVIAPGLGLIAVIPGLIALVLGVWARSQVRTGIADREDFASLGFVFGLVVCLHWGLGIASLIA